LVGWVAGQEYGGVVVGFPPLPLGDGLQQQRGPGGYVGVAGLGRFPFERAVVDGVAGSDPGAFEELPNELRALASVVGGLVGTPIIAVPTSVGYGASFGGVAALLSMLNSCAPGVTVVNIDNGYGAAVAASRIARQTAFRPTL